MSVIDTGLAQAIASGLGLGQSRRRLEIDREEEARRAALAERGLGLREQEYAQGLADRSSTADALSILLSPELQGPTSDGLPLRGQVSRDQLAGLPEGTQRLIAELTLSQREEDTDYNREMAGAAAELDAILGLLNAGAQSEMGPRGAMEPAPSAIQGPSTDQYVAASPAARRAMIAQMAEQDARTEAEYEDYLDYMRKTRVISEAERLGLYNQEDAALARKSLLSRFIGLQGGQIPGEAGIKPEDYQNFYGLSPEQAAAGANLSRGAGRFVAPSATMLQGQQGLSVSQQVQSIRHLHSSAARRYLALVENPFASPQDIEAAKAELDQLDLVLRQSAGIGANSGAAGGGVQPPAATDEDALADQAYDNLVAAGIASPNAQQVSAEMARIRGGGGAP